MDPRVVLEWLDVLGWSAVDDRLHRAIIARDTPRRLGRSGNGTGTDDRPAVNAGDPDSGGSASPTLPHRTRVVPSTGPSKFSMPAFRLSGRGVF